MYIIVTKKTAYFKTKDDNVIFVFLKKNKCNFTQEYFLMILI